MKSGKIDLNKKQWILLLINGILIIAFLLLTIFAGRAIGGLYSQQEATRWGGKDDSYAQVSAFISPRQNLSEEGIRNMRNSLVQTLSEDSYNEEKGTGRLFIDAYSGECNTTVRKDTNVLSATAVGVGGDFFQFHPIPLLAGGYISEEDLNHDRIVVDEGFAWAMFGSNDVVGMQVWVGNNIYVVAGVVAVEEDTLYKTAYGSGNRIYMSYDQLKWQQPEGLSITCYEAVLPNPISNYAYYALRKACGLEEEEENPVEQEENAMNFTDIEIIENSNRYKQMPLFTKAKQIKFRSMRTSSIGYPFWENIAKVAEEQQILLLFMRIALLVFPCICFVWWIVGLWRRRTWSTKDIVVGLLDKMREKQALKQEAKALEEEAAEEMEEGYEQDTEDGEERDYEEEDDYADAEKSEGEEVLEDAELQAITSEDIFTL